MAKWGVKGQRAAHLSLVFDYGYMLSCGLFFALAGFAVRDRARARAGDGSRPAARSFRSSRSSLRPLTRAKTSLSCCSCSERVSSTGRPGVAQRPAQ
jgi:hypothetical protein